MSKYFAKQATVDGMVFHSQKEAHRYEVLKNKQDWGYIRNLQMQVPYTLIDPQRDEDGKVIERRCRYVADFVYTDNETGETICEDVKGYRKGSAYALFTIKRKLMLEKHGIRVREV